MSRKPRARRPAGPTNPKTYRKRAVMEFVDFDYADKLSDEERAWLTKFSREYYGGDFVGEPLHNEEQRKEIQNRLNQYNTARDNAGRATDAFAMARVRKQLDQPDHADSRNNPNGWEALLTSEEPKE